MQRCYHRYKESTTISRVVALLTPQIVGWGPELNRLLRKHPSFDIFSDDELSVAQVNEVELYLSTKRDWALQECHWVLSSQKRHIPRSFWYGKRLLGHTSYVRTLRVVLLPHEWCCYEEKKSNIPGKVKMLAFLKYRLSGSKRTPSSSDGEGALDELDELDDGWRDGGEMDGDSCYAARTSKGKNPAAMEIVIWVDKLSQD